MLAHPPSATRWTCLYDVIRKPTIRPYKATPEENRKYKKDGTLYAGQHEHDENPHEWEARLMADISERPDYYFQRVEVVRSESDLSDYLFDMWAVGREIADAERIGRWSRNPERLLHLRLVRVLRRMHRMREP